MGSISHWEIIQYFYIHLSLCAFPLQGIKDTLAENLKKKKTQKTKNTEKQFLRFAEVEKWVYR